MRHLFADPRSRISAHHAALFRIVVGLWLVLLFIYQHNRLQQMDYMFNWLDEASFSARLVALRYNSIFYISGVAGAIMLILGWGRRFVCVFLMFRAGLAFWMPTQSASYYGIILTPILAPLGVMFSMQGGEALRLGRDSRRDWQIPHSRFLFVLACFSLFPFFGASQSPGNFTSLINTFFNSWLLIPPLLVFRQTRPLGVLILLSAWIFLSLRTVPHILPAGVVVLILLCFESAWLPPAKNVASGRILIDPTHPFLGWLLRVLLIEDLDRVLSVSAISGGIGEEIRERRHHLPEDARVAYVRNLEEDSEEVYHASDAILRVCADIGGLLKLLAVFILLPQWFRDGCLQIIYRGFEVCPRTADLPIDDRIRL